MKNLIVIIALSFLVFGCRDGEAGYNYDDSYTKEESAQFPRGNWDDPESAPEAGAAPDMDQFLEGEGQPEGRSDIPVPTAPKIIRNADVTLKVEDYAKGREALGQLVQRSGATIAHESEVRSSYEIRNRFVIRLAPEKLDSFITGLEALALHVESKSIDSRDVTREFVDMETRLAAKRATLDRYREILRSAKNVQEILAVEQQLRAIIEEIESVEGQLRYLRDQVQLSTVNLTLYQEFDRPDVVRPSFWKRIGSGFSQGWFTFLDILVGLVYIWPIALIIAGVSWWIVRRIRRRKKA